MPQYQINRRAYHPTTLPPDEPIKQPMYSPAGIFIYVLICVFTLLFMWGVWKQPKEIPNNGKRCWDEKGRVVRCN